MTAGRKPLTTPNLATTDLQAPSLDGALSVMRETAISEEMSIRAEVYRLGQLVGARQMACAAAQFLRAADIQLFEEISKSKGYKHIPVEHPDGNIRPAENIQDFCRLVFKKSYSVMAESRQALAALGEECYEIATDLGLKRTQLRLLLSLPEDEREAVKAAMQADSKAEVVGLIESMANKLDEARAEVEHLKADMRAVEDISAEKSRRLETLLREKARIKAAPPDQVLADLQSEATRMTNDVRGGVVGQLRQALIALHGHAEVHGGSAPTVFMAGLVGQLEDDLRALRAEFALPEVSADEHGWIDARD